MPISFHIFDFCIFICIFVFYNIIYWYAELWKEKFLKELIQH